MLVMQSNMETSTSWPSPVRSRWRRAVITLRATNSAVTPSQMDSATLAGDSGVPVISITPVSAWISPSKAFMSR